MEKEELREYKRVKQRERRKSLSNLTKNGICSESQYVCNDYDEEFPTIEKVTLKKKLKDMTADERREHDRSRKKRSRENLRSSNESIFKKLLADEKSNQRQKARDDDESKLRNQWAEEK